MPAAPEVHLLAGLNGAGKTTYARRLERDLPAVRFTLDEWVLRLYHLPYDHPDYAAAAARCRELIWDCAVQVLRAGVPVVLDWNLWSRARRSESVTRGTTAGFGCVLHYIRVPIEVAVEQAAARVDPTAHDLSPEGVRHLASIFEPPGADEGVTVVEVGDAR